MGSTYAQLRVSRTAYDADDRLAPGDVDFISMGGASRLHSCVKLVNGEVHCWGANAGAQLGLGHSEDIGDDEEPDSEDQVRIIGVDLAGGSDGRIQRGAAEAVHGGAG